MDVQNLTIYRDYSNNKIESGNYPYTYQEQVDLYNQFKDIETQLVQNTGDSSNNQQVKRKSISRSNIVYFNKNQDTKNRKSSIESSQYTTIKENRENESSLLRSLNPYSIKAIDVHRRMNLSRRSDFEQAQKQTLKSNIHEKLAILQLISNSQDTQNCVIHARKKQEYTARPLSNRRATNFLGSQNIQSLNVSIDAKASIDSLCGLINKSNQDSISNYHLQTPYQSKISQKIINNRQRKSDSSSRKLNFEMIATSYNKSLSQNINLNIYDSKETLDDKYAYFQPYNFESKKPSLQKLEQSLQCNGYTQNRNLINDTLNSRQSKVFLPEEQSNKDVNQLSTSTINRFNEFRSQFRLLINQNEDSMNISNQGDTLREPEDQQPVFDNPKAFKLNGGIRKPIDRRFSQHQQTPNIQYEKFINTSRSNKSQNPIIDFVNLYQSGSINEVFDFYQQKKNYSSYSGFLSTNTPKNATQFQKMNLTNRTIHHQYNSPSSKDRSKHQINEPVTQNIFVQEHPQTEIEKSHLFQSQSKFNSTIRNTNNRIQVSVGEQQNSMLKKTFNQIKAVAKMDDVMENVQIKLDSSRQIQQHEFNTCYEKFFSNKKNRRILGLLNQNIANKPSLK